MQQEVLFPNSSFLLFVSLRTPHCPSATTPSLSFALQKHFSKEVSLFLGSASYPPFFLKLTLSPFGPLHSGQTFCQGVYIAKPNTFVPGPAMDCRISLLLTHLRALDEAFKSLGCLGGAGLSIASFWWQTCDRWVITYCTSKGQIPGVCWRLEWEIVLLTSDVTRQPAIWDHLYSTPGPVPLNSRQCIPIRFFSIFFLSPPIFPPPFSLGLYIIAWNYNHRAHSDLHCFQHVIKAYSSWGLFPSFSLLSHHKWGLLPWLSLQLMTWILWGRALLQQ